MNVKRETEGNDKEKRARNFPGIIKEKDGRYRERNKGRKKNKSVEVKKEANRQNELDYKVSNGYVSGYAGYVNLCRIAPSLY